MFALAPKPDLPTETGMYWASMYGDEWDSILEIIGTAPHFHARVITFGKFWPMARCHAVDPSKATHPRAIGPRIDYPAEKPATAVGGAEANTPQIDEL